MPNAEWREIQYWSLPGHAMMMLPEFEMGEGVSGVTLYCMTCDGDGERIAHCDFWNWPDVEHVYEPKEAMVALRKAAMKHYKEGKKNA